MGVVREGFPKEVTLWLREEKQVVKGPGDRERAFQEERPA